MKAYGEIVGSLLRVWVGQRSQEPLLWYLLVGNLLRVELRVACIGTQPSRCTITVQ